MQIFSRYSRKDISECRESALEEARRFGAVLFRGSSIRKEYEWRVSRGESLKNLEAFRGWLEAGSPPPEDDRGGP